MFRLILCSTLLFILFYSADSKLLSAVEEFDFPSFKDSPEIGFTVEISPYPSYDFKFHDFNNDGQLDIVNYCGKRTTYFSFRTLANKVIQEEPLENPVKGMHVVDINQDGFSELIYYSIENYVGYLNIYFVAEDSTITIPIAEGREVHTEYIWDSWMIDARLMKKSTGEVSLLLSLTTGHDFHPRGIYALNLKTFKFDWKFEIGARPWKKILIEDINHDEKPEILFSTLAPDNGVVQNSYPDTTSHFFILDENGKELWNFPFCNGISYCFFKYRPDYHDVLIFGYTKESARKSPPVYQVNLADFTIQKEIESGYENEKIVSSKPNTKMKKNELFYLKSDIGYLRIFNEKLQQTHELNFHHTVRYAFHSDINGDKEDEWIVFLALQSGDIYRAVILDSEFRVIGSNELPELTGVHFDSDSLKKETKIFYKNYNTKKIKAWVIPWGEIVSPSSLAFYWKTSRSVAIYVIATVFVLAIVGVLLQNIYKQNFTNQKLYRIANYFLNNPVDAYLIINDGGVVEDYSPAFATLFQLPSKHLKNTKINKLLSESNAHELLGLINQSLAEMELNSTSHETLDFVQNGSYRKLRIDISKIEIRKKHFVVLIEFSDLSKIAKSDRVASWASMARNMAHEIKNPLMTITLSLGRLEKKLSKEVPGEETKGEKYIDFIRDEVKKMRNTVNQFMRFTSSLQFHFQNYELEKLLREVVDLYKNRESQRITFGINIDENLSPIWIDGEQTRNILINILDNAIDAIAGEGEIIVTATGIEKICEHSGQVQNWIEVQISDNGMGIAKDNLGKIFEPNFTTKSTGAGFGLSIAKHVMEEQGGEISICSTPEVGTTVTLLFPTALS